jgi:hypothetical protein
VAWKSKVSSHVKTKTKQPSGTDGWKGCANAFPSQKLSDQDDNLGLSLIAPVHECNLINWTFLELANTMVFVRTDRIGQ